MTRNALLLSVALVLTGASQSFAATKFFDNYPFSDTYGFIVCNAETCGVNKSPAFQFTTNLSGTTSKVFAPVKGDLLVLLRADNNGVPGRVLAKKHTTKRVHVAIFGHLESGTPYWLEIAPARNANVGSAWLASKSNTTCLLAENDYGTGWTTSQVNPCPAAKIVGTADAN